MSAQTTFLLLKLKFFSNIISLEVYTHFLVLLTSQNNPRSSLHWMLWTQSSLDNRLLTKFIFFKQLIKNFDVTTSVVIPKKINWTTN